MKTLFTIINLCMVLSIQLFAENYPYRNDLLWVTLPDHADWLYKTGEKATISVAVYEYGIPLDNQKINFSIGQDCLDPDIQGTVTLNKGKAEIEIGTMKKPGFLDCQLSLKRNGQTHKHHIKVGFSPEKIKPYTQMPADFKEFWQEKVEQQATNCPMNPEVKYIEKFSSDKVDCFLVKLQCYKKGQFVYGYLTKPKKKGSYPVVISPPGAGIKPMNPIKTIFYAENEIIRFDMEIHGINPGLDEESYKNISATFGGHDANGYLANGIHDRESYYMKRVYLACIRAVDYLCTLPEWDGKNMIAQGGSQGGALALMLTGLDPRITACVANHPALSDMCGYAEKRRTGGYPHFGRKYQGIELTPDIIRTLSYYDVINFARCITVPVFLTWGYNDNVCPPTTSYAVYNTINSQKEALITPINEHWTSAETNKAQLEWIKNKTNRLKEIPRDTSFTLNSAYIKEKKYRPYIQIAAPQTEGIKTTEGIAYSLLTNNRELHLNIYRPDNKEILPALLMVHGGGWNSGDLSLQIPMAKQIAANGYVTVPVEYRLIPEALYPAALQDLQEAIRWLRTHASEYGIDPNRIAISGCSAGGQLANLVGTINDISCNVQAVINLDGLSDFTQPEIIERAQQAREASRTLPVDAIWLGGTYEEKKENWISASPLHNVTEKSAPVCFINSSIPRFHAGRDEQIKKMNTLGIYSEVHTQEDTPHTFWFFHPWFEPTTQLMVNFLDKIFK